MQSEPVNRLVSRELKRNTGQRGYRHKQAQRLSADRRHQASKAVKMTKAMMERVEEKLMEKWSPEQISGWLSEEHGESLSHDKRVAIFAKAEKERPSSIQQQKSRDH